MEQYHNDIATCIVFESNIWGRQNKISLLVYNYHAGSPSSFPNEGYLLDPVVPAASTLMAIITVYLTRIVFPK